MRKTVLLLLASCLPLGAAGPTTFVGTITDDMCGNDHKMMNISPDSKCVLECVKGGSKFALVSGGKVYKLSDQQKPAKFPGQKVTVTGTLAGDTITVTSVAAAK